MQSNLKILCQSSSPPSMFSIPMRLHRACHQWLPCSCHQWAPSTSSIPTMLPAKRPNIFAGDASTATQLSHPVGDDRHSIPARLSATNAGFTNAHTYGHDHIASTSFEPGIKCANTRPARCSGVRRTRLSRRNPNTSSRVKRWAEVPSLVHQSTLAAATTRTQAPCTRRALPRPSIRLSCLRLTSPASPHLSLHRCRQVKLAASNSRMRPCVILRLCSRSRRARHLLHLARQPLRHTTAQTDALSLPLCMVHMRSSRVNTLPCDMVLCQWPSRERTLSSSGTSGVVLCR